jgi:hypothetical protein
MSTANPKKKRSKQNEKIEPLIPKKRGRKPKGGKIITVTEKQEQNNALSSNVIVHLKCKKSDLCENTFEAEQPKSNDNFNNNVIENTFEQVTHKKEMDDIKNINEKLKELQVKLHNNTICETDSACFWCTYNFSNLPIAIPKFEINDTYHVYGCFCSPECACAHLMSETIDSSLKFERYHLLCYIYAKVYNYKNNIKPAPDPRYTLKKFFGNLTIEEYRQLFDSQRYLFIIDKPITRELPELHEEYKNESKFTYSNKNQLIMQTFNA